MRYRKKMEKATISMTAMDHCWTPPKARGVKISRKMMPRSMILSMKLSWLVPLNHFSHCEEQECGCVAVGKIGALSPY